jgi:hypothetical protein
MIRDRAAWWVCALLFAAGGVAQGQTVHGTGRALDASLAAGTGSRVNPGVSGFAEAMSFRNAVVSGLSSPQGSLRRTAGYRTTDEFLTPTGAEGLFGGRRDSLLTSLSGYGIRGTEALQYQFALTVGTPLTPQQQSMLPVRTSPASAPSFTLSPSFAAADPTDPLGDRRGNALVSLRSPSAYESTLSSEPSLVGIRRTNDGQQLAVTASPLESIAIVPLSTLTARAPAPTPQTPHDEILNRLAATGVPGVPDGLSPTWSERISALRDQLRSSVSLAGQPAPPDVPVVLDLQTVGLIRSASSRLSSLLPLGDPQQTDPYWVWMQSAQDYLSRGRYFDAEGAFSMAIQSRSGDVMASIGRVHAQIGAGLYLSAALNLRTLLTAHPEVAGTTYEEGLLPASSRVPGVVADLREQIRRGPPRSHSAGLILAYVGWLTGDTGLIREGLDAMDDHEGPPDPLVTLLGSFWLGSEGPDDSADGGER